MQCTCTPTEAAEILKDCGFKIGYDKLLRGMQVDSTRARADRIFPFGDAFLMSSGKWSYVIYENDLYCFIREHGGEILKERAVVKG